MTKRVLDDKVIFGIKRLRNLKTRQGKTKYTIKRLAKIYSVDEKTIRNYLKQVNKAGVTAK